MSIVLVDNNKENLILFAAKFAKIFPELQLKTFTDPFLSAKYICNNEVVLAFLSINMRPVDGMILLRTLRANKPMLPIVMMDESEIARDATIYEPANGCISKPISYKILENSVKNLLVNRLSRNLESSKQQFKG